ncbi:ectonucleoside triphosphate diphosphohydrolase 1-like isoform X1 [Mercenaria mercenaria]|uniref:ectonucleoside triphosphate diphosphohydrolase 1-like isoform X1 n=1 Tax=Mercenaria mercenaria TaxID=6596 RepID=UPI00234F1F60|nr:ectonucleoside triphosphate diphosphohydrolase 1-like isoform X1 [Mercenaria mercenaria]
MMMENAGFRIYISVFLFVTFFAFKIAALPLSEDNNKFGIILDAGSSSTKIRIYTWQDTIENVPNFNEIFYKKVKPGISSFHENADEISTYLRSILKVLEGELPPLLRPRTSLYFMATAGLRLLDEETTSSIMSAVKQVLMDPMQNPFKFEEENAHILAGEEEALFAWLTVNYLNDFFTKKGPASDSLGLIELGGGSAQIAFIPDDPIYAGKMPATIAGQEYGVYCHSYLSYGATLMSERIAELLIQENKHANVIINPCMLKGDSRNGTLGYKMVAMIGGGNASLCEDLLKYYLAPADDDMCSPKPCSIGQVYQPSVKNKQFFTFGLIYYLAKDFEILSEPGLLDLKQLQNTVRGYCEQSYEYATETLGMSEKYASRNCQDGLYIPLLFSALGLDIDNVIAAKDLKGSSIAWSLGGMLYEEERNRYQELASQLMEL